MEQEPKKSPARSLRYAYNIQLPPSKVARPELQRGFPAWSGLTRIGGIHIILGF
jgi:hypothetical protein